MKKEFEPSFIAQSIIQRLQDLGYKHIKHKGLGYVYLKIYFQDKEGDWVFMRCDEDNPKPEANNDALKRGSYKMWEYSNFSKYSQYTFFEEVNKAEIEHISISGKGIETILLDSWENFTSWLGMEGEKAIYLTVPISLYNQLEEFSQGSSKKEVIIQALREFFDKS